MLHKTRGIVLNYIKYKETSVIARAYTEVFGIQSYIINGIRSSKSKKGLALLQPLTILDMVVYHRTGKEAALNRLSEYKPAISFRSIPFDIRKSTISLFITELLYKVLKEEEHHGSFFNYLFDLIRTLDERSQDFENIHLQLMVHLTHHLGFGIFDTDQLRLEGGTVLDKDIENDIYQTIIALGNENTCQIKMNNEKRRIVLHFMINYYIRHIEGFESMNSVQVLAQIFN